MGRSGALTSPPHRRALTTTPEAPVSLAYRVDVLLASDDITTPGGTAPRLGFGEEPGPPDAGPGRRVLFLDEEPAYGLSFWCGTCPFLFERLEGANDTLSIEDLQTRLNDGLDELDRQVIDRFAALLPGGRYLAMLLVITPRLIHPVKDGDYFAEEQVATWGLDGFWGLPEYPHTAYYRTFQTRVDDESHLFEFVVPMLPPASNDRETVAQHVARLETSSRPTAVAVSTLDVCQPAMDHGTDYYSHWGLTHFLLDGHHKMHAAAVSGQPLQLLSLLSVEGSLAAAEHVATIPPLRSLSPAPRHPH
jgi:hypothetical protein